LEHRWQNYERRDRAKYAKAMKDEGRKYMAQWQAKMNEKINMTEKTDATRERVK